MEHPGSLVSPAVVVVLAALAVLPSACDAPPAQDAAEMRMGPRGDSACPTPREGGEGALSAGDRCSDSADCASGICLPSEEGGSCAGTTPCARGFRPAMFERCDGEALTPICVPARTRAPLGWGTAGQSCQSDDDCATSPVEHRCGFDSRGVGTCRVECAASGLLAQEQQANRTRTPSTVAPLPLEGSRDEQYCSLGPDVHSLAEFALATVGPEARHVDWEATEAWFDTEPEGKTLYVPPGDWILDTILQVPSDFTIFGHGHYGPDRPQPHSWLHRSSVYHSCGDLQCPKEWCQEVGEACTVCPVEGVNGRGGVIRNRNHGCEDSDIVLRNFGVRSDDPSPATGPHGDTRVAIQLGSVRDTLVTGLYLQDVPQDGIFLQTPGQGVEVTDNVIEGWMTWFNQNGGAVIIEMHDCKGVASEADRVRVVGNRIISTSSTGANATLPEQVGGILANKKAVSIDCTTDQQPTVRMHIADNEIEVHHGQMGISCLHCGLGSIVEGNLVRPRAEECGTEDADFLGIQVAVLGDALFGAVPGLEGIEVVDNRIEACEGPTASARGIFVGGPRCNTDTTRVAGNVVERWGLGDRPAVQVSSRVLEFEDNVVSLMGTQTPGVPAVELGRFVAGDPSQRNPLREGSVSGNTITSTDGPALDATFCADHQVSWAAAQSIDGPVVCEGAGAEVPGLGACSGTIPCDSCG